MQCTFFGTKPHIFWGFIEQDKRAAIDFIFTNDLQDYGESIILKKPKEAERRML